MGWERVTGRPVARSFHCHTPPAVFDWLAVRALCCNQTDLQMSGVENVRCPLKGLILNVSALDIALLLLRVVAGLTLAAHGAQKLFGWFGGAGLKRILRGFAAQGLRPAWLWVTFALLGEVGGGLSLVFGFLTPLGAAGAFGAMLMATSTHWKKGFFNSKGGLEYPLLLMVVALALGIAGPGGLAIDTLLGIARIEVPLFAALALGALVVVVVGILIRRPAAPAVATPAETTMRAS